MQSTVGYYEFDLRHTNDARFRGLSWNLSHEHNKFVERTWFSAFGNAVYFCQFFNILLFKIVNFCLVYFSRVQKKTYKRRTVLLEINCYDYLIIDLFYSNTVTLGYKKKTCKNTFKATNSADNKYTSRFQKTEWNFHQSTGSWSRQKANYTSTMIYECTCVRIWFAENKRYVSHEYAWPGHVYRFAYSHAGQRCGRASSPWPAVDDNVHLSITGATRVLTV